MMRIRLTTRVLAGCVPSLCLLLAAPLAAQQGAAAPSQDRPNILWITAEDMSATLGCWGDAYAATPHIDALAKESVIYTQAFATAPVCSPARSCIITGCYATTLGTQRLRSEFPIPSQIRGFPSYLRERGYYCTNNVKTDYNTSREPEIVRESWDESSAQASWSGRDEGQPFFAVFNHMTSHQSRTMVMPYAQFVKDVQNRLPESQIHRAGDAPIPPYYPDTPEMRQGMARYYDCISAMDAEVGELLQRLEADGLADETIVFFYSDHGSGMPRHKRALLDSGLHVPLMIRFPPKYQHLAPAAPGARLDRLISFVDLAPTMLNLCGIRIPETMQGLPFLGPQADRTREYVFGARDRVDEAFDLARSVRNGKYLYIRNFMPHLSYHQPSYYPDQGTIRAEISRYAAEHAGELSAAQEHYVAPTRPLEELYDVQNDPWNITNLAEAPEHQETLGQMRDALRQWMLQSRDLGFLPEEEMWARIADQTPYDLRNDPEKYPLRRLLQTAALVGSGTQALPDMVAGLADDEPGVRYWSAIAIGALGTQGSSAAQALRTAAGDEHVAVRIEAANALAHIGQLSDGVRVLMEELDNADLNAVLHAARAIELLGPRARAAVPAMQQTRQRAAGPGTIEMFVRFSADAFLSRVAAGSTSEQ